MNKNENNMRKIILSLILALAAQFSLAAVPDSLKRDLEDYDYLVSFVEENYAPFDAIMQKGYKREYKALKKQLRKQLRKGESNLEKAVGEYVFWFFSQFDGHLSLETMAFQLDYVCKVIPRYDLMMNYAPKPVSCRVDSCTWLIRVPTCEEEVLKHEWAKNAAQQYIESGCDNLIIDVRGNMGGDASVWKPYYDMLYDHAGKDIVVWFRNTKENLTVSERYVPDEDFVERCNSSKEKLVLWAAMTNKSERKPLIRPKRAAILIDRLSCSAGESIVSYVKNNSNRAKVYGKENTWGASETGNINTTLLPNSKMPLSYPTCVHSSFYNKIFIGAAGLTPDIIIPLDYPKQLTDNIDEWVLWVAEDLKR